MESLAVARGMDHFIYVFALEGQSPYMVNLLSVHTKLGMPLSEKYLLIL
jgi:hypothetical protein